MALNCACLNKLFTLTSLKKCTNYINETSIPIYLSAAILALNYHHISTLIQPKNSIVVYLMLMALGVAKLHPAVLERLRSRTKPCGVRSRRYSLVSRTQFHRARCCDPRPPHSEGKPRSRTATV